MQAVWVALIVAVFGFLGPMLLKRQDYKRQDEVAKRVAEAAEALAASTANTNLKLDQIHTLVNSNMTAAMQAELDATIREVAMMREVIAMNEAAGREPSQAALVAAQMTDNRIAELRAALADRLTATGAAAAAAAAAPNPS